ncbi:phosphatase PAP2 family protein [Halomonas sp. Bachu 37]|uniref:phosphatase PAP2 family protein n=1 Tax=Halomonas kashgarensis TaxID=3084920 RepID=UPI00321667CB
MRPRTLVVFDRLDLLEWQLCQRFTRLSLYRPWRLLLQAASRLGDWPVWVALILAQPWLQPQQPWSIVQYTLTALAALGFYRLLKTRLCRERPFITYSHGIRCSEPARDRYSFPSGHTMHAIMFSIMVAVHTPWLLPVVLPLTLLIALSRVGLGLHYISDVLAGAAIGCIFALVSLMMAS